MNEKKLRGVVSPWTLYGDVYQIFFFFLSLEDWFQFVAEKHNFAIVVEVDLFS